MAFEEPLRWVFVALLAATGVAMLVLANRPFPIASLIPARAGGTTRARLESAAARRGDVPAVPVAATVAGPMLIAAAATGAVLRAPVAVLFALVYVAFGTGLVTSAVRERTAGRRGASLRKRSPFRHGPWFLYVLPLAQALAALPLIPLLPLSAPLAIAVTALLLLSAWRTAAAPARIAGVDPEAELFLEERLRRPRLQQLLLVAPMPLLGVDIYGGVHGNVALPLVFVTFVAVVVAAAWYIAVVLRLVLRSDAPTFSADA